MKNGTRLSGQISVACGRRCINHGNTSEAGALDEDTENELMDSSKRLPQQTTPCCQRAPVEICDAIYKT